MSSPTTPASSSSSKFTSPPSIAAYWHHKEWMAQVVETVKQNVHDEKAIRLLEELGDPADVPLKLQGFANRHSLKPTPEEKALQDAIQELPRAGMAGAPDEANLLCMLLEMMDAILVVEVGVFRGVTTLAFAQCLQKLADKSTLNAPRKVIGLDIFSEYAEIGQEFWKLAGVQDTIDLRIGDAKESMTKLLEEYGENSVDLCFIDADKTSYDDYYEKSVKLTKSGGLIVVDNTLWGGRVVIPDELLRTLALSSTDGSGSSEETAMLARFSADTLAIKQLAAKIYQDDRIERVSFLNIADGVTICRKK